MAGIDMDGFCRSCGARMTLRDHKCNRRQQELKQEESKDNDKKQRKHSQTKKKEDEEEQGKLGVQ
jgi:hypothetical protein